MKKILPTRLSNGIKIEKKKTIKKMKDVQDRKVEEAIYIDRYQ